MSKITNAIVRIHVDADTGESDGIELAKALRLAADYAERSIQMVRYSPQSEWIPETHRVSPEITIKLP